MKSLFMKKSEKRSIGIMGLWHLGCVYSISLAKLGFEVYGFDFNKKTVNDLRNNISPIFEPSFNELLKKYNNKNLYFSNSKEGIIKNRDYLFICYDLPVDNNDTAQTEIIDKTFIALSKLASPNTIIVISSQIPIGTSRILVNLMRKRGNDNPKVIYFPENLRLGQAFTSFLNPDRIILGSDNVEALDQFKIDFPFKCPFITMSLESAEMAKHALNSYLATCISFSGELSDLSEKTGANMLDVIKALKTDKRVSPFAPINPGLGFAGGTLGRDIQSLLKIARDKKYFPKLLSAVYSVNQNRLPILLSKVRSVYPSLRNKSLGILGLTYKPNTNTLRRSMSLLLASQLRDKGCRIKAFDPAIKNAITDYPFIEICPNLITFSTDLDLIILMTEWPEFLEVDLAKLSTMMKNKVIIDTKNFLKSSACKQAGFTYLGMGV